MVRVGPKILDLGGQAKNFNFRATFGDDPKKILLEGQTLQGFGKCLILEEIF